MEIEDKELSEERDKLMQESEAYKNAIHDQVESIRNRAEQWGKTFLLIGSTFIITYSLIKAWIDRQDEEEEETSLPVAKASHNENTFFHTIMNQIALFLVAVARDKLLEFLKTIKDTNEEHTEHPE